MSESALNHAATFAAIASGGLLWILEGAMPFFKGRRNRLRHAIPNLAVAAFNAALSATLLIGSLGVLAWVRPHWQGLRGLFENDLLASIALVVGYDFWMYLWHRLNHQVPFFWRFHRFHHQDEAMDVTTGFRFHPMELALSELLRLPALMLLGMGATELALYNLLAFPVILLHHSNVALPERLDKALAIAIPSPNLHRVHHSAKREETDSNYGSLLSIWDRMFGSLRRRDDFVDFRFGVDERL